MNSKKTFIAAVLVAALPIAALTSCSSDNDEPNGGSAGEGLDNEVVLSMLKGDKDKATKLDGVYIGEDNNFQTDDYYQHGYYNTRFALTANVKKLGDINFIPKSGWADKIAVRKGYGYVWYNGTSRDFYRIYVDDEVRDTDGNVIGYNIRYQHPFYGKDEDIQLAKDELSFTNEGGMEEIKFLDNEPICFSCKSSADWCRVTPTSSLSKSFLTNAVDVSVAASDFIGDSTATITLTTGYGKKKEIKVTRGAAEPRMKLYDGNGSYVTSMNLPVSGTGKYVYVNSNIPLENIDVENTASSWCEVKLEKNSNDDEGHYHRGYGNYILRITATANDADVKRTGIITLKYRNGDTGVKLNVEQEAPYITMDNGYSEGNPYTTNYYSGSTELYFRTNIDWSDLKVSNSASWLSTSLYGYNSYSDYVRGYVRLYFNSRNNSSSDREDVVTISNKKGTVICKFKVVQSAY